MKKKEGVKNLYLLVTIFIVIIGIGFGSTFAIFNSIATIDNPITFNSNLSSTNLLVETIDVTVPAGEEKNVDVIVSNTYSEDLNYSVWYNSSSSDLEVGSESSDNSYGPIGRLSSGSNFTLTIELKNNSDNSIIVTIGISSSSNNIVLPNGVVMVPETSLS